MAQYHWRTTISTDPQTVTFSSLSTSLEGRSLTSVSDSYSKPVVFVQEESGDRRFRISSINKTGSNYVSFTIDASDAGVTLPVDVIVQVNTFELVSSVSNAKSTTNSVVRRILKDTSGDTTIQLLLDAELNERIDDAVRIYSKDKPRELTRDIAGTGEHDYSLPSEWYNDFSSVIEVEYPASSIPKDIIEVIDWAVYEPDETEYTINSASASDEQVTLSTATEALFFVDGDRIEVGDDSSSELVYASADGNTTTGVVTISSALTGSYSSNPYVKRVKTLRIINYTPSTTEIIRLRFTTLHVHTDSSDTVPTSDYQAFTHLCASIAADSIAAKFGQGIDAVYTADSVDNLSKVTFWHEIAEQQMSIYNQYMGKGEEATKAAVGETEMDTAFTWGSDYVFHSRRWR